MEERRLYSVKQIWNKISERKGMNVKINLTRPERVKDCYRNKYQDMDKDVKRMTERDKKDYIDNLAEKAEVVTARICFTPS